MPTEVHAHVSLVEGMQFSGRNPKGLGVLMDSRSDGNAPAGASPMELILQAAGGCSLMDIVHILRKRHTPPELLEVEINGIKRDEHPKIYKEIAVIYRAKGEGITQTDLENAAKLSMETFCSVFGMLKQVAEVTWHCEVIA